MTSYERMLYPSKVLCATAWDLLFNLVTHVSQCWSRKTLRSMLHIKALIIWISFGLIYTGTSGQCSRTPRVIYVPLLDSRSETSAN